MLLFEDLHWIDTETQAWLDSLVESPPASSLLLIASYRPEYQHVWGSKTYYRQLRIDPLLPESADALLTRELHGLAYAHRERLGASISGFAEAVGWPFVESSPVV